jgi:methyl-galactoside transport system permease protein
MSSYFCALPNHMPGNVYMEVRNLTSAQSGSFTDVSFTLRCGEILGVGGLVGAQRTELVETLFGLRPLVSGSISIDGTPVNIKKPVTAIKNGLALLTEDRKASGIVPMLSIVENTVVANQTIRIQDYLGKLFFLDEKKRRKDTEKYVEALSIKTPSIKQQIQYLSGGNQQKVLLGRWLLTNPNILILDEPTRGIDVGAKYEIYVLMEKLAQEGKCIIMITSEMPELLGMSDRILVMCEGHLSGILNADNASPEEVMYYASTYEDAKKKRRILPMSNTKRFNTKHFFLGNAIYIILLTLVVIITCISPKFLSFRVFRDILMQSSVRIIMALGCMFICIAGSADLSGGRMLGLTAVIAGTLAQKATYHLKYWPDLPELPVIVPILAAITVGIIFGIFNGLVVSKLKVPAFLATLGTQMILLGINSIYFNRPPNNSQPLGGYTESFGKLGTDAIFNIPYVLIIAFICLVVVWLAQTKTRFGHELFTMGGNREAARVSGINVFKIEILTFAIAGALYGLAGSLEAARTGSATSSFGNGYELDAIASCIVGGCSLSGGVGNVAGVLAGVVIFNVISYGLTFIGISPYWQYAVKGSIIIVAVAIDVRKHAGKK